MRTTLFYIFLALFSLSLLSACSKEKPKPKKKKPKTTATKAKPKTSELAAPAEPVEEVIPIPPEQLEKAGKIISSVDEDAVAAADGKKLYRFNCTVCHGMKGDMKLNGAKDLRKQKTTLQERVAQIYFGKGLMTPFKNVLKEEEIVAVAKYVEELKKLK